MGGSEIFFLIFTMLGGVALFIFGMNTMTDGLRVVAGSRMRAILAGATSHRVWGLALGTILGTLMYSGGATVMLVGFVNAGLMNLAQAVPVVLGANIGTTLAMQAVSLRLGDYALFAIAIGFIIRMVAPSPQYRSAGLTLMGFGFLFLGMNIMSDAIKPHRETLAPLIESLDADTWISTLLGILLAAGITAAVQSSGAVIGMTFALIQAGVFTQLEQTFPIVLGAHIGTCTVALIASIGAQMPARRVAIVHLLFNLFNVTIALLTKGLFLRLVEFTSADLLRQTANLHTAVMLIPALVALPFTGMVARWVTRVVRGRRPDPAPSYLDDKLLKYPEQALAASIHELQRVARICAHSCRMTVDVVLFDYKARLVQSIKLNEQIINDVKLAMKDYLAQLADRSLSRRQAVLLQHIDRCTSDLERIGDHVDSICDLSIQRRKVPEARVDVESLDIFFELYTSVLKILNLVITSLDPDRDDIPMMAKHILDARDEYILRSINAKAAFTDKVTQRTITPIAGVYFSGYIAALDRIVRHCKSIALSQKQPQFWIKRKKLPRQVEVAPPKELYQKVNPKEYLDRIKLEEYF